MSMKQGETYSCSKASCGCEMTVKKDSGTGGGDQAPKCCCGTDMKLA